MGDCPTTPHTMYVVVLVFRVSYIVGSSVPMLFNEIPEQETSVALPETSVLPGTSEPDTTVLPWTSLWYNGVKFETGVQVTSPVLEVLDVTGVSMCLRRCQRYGAHCALVTYNTDTLQCSLGFNSSSIVSAPSSFITSTSTSTSLGHRCGAYSDKHGKPQTPRDPCSPNTCSGGDRCVVLKTGISICIQPDPVPMDDTELIEMSGTGGVIMVDEPLYYPTED